MKTKRELKIVLDNLIKATKNLDACEATKIKVEDNNLNLIFCDRNSKPIFELTESNESNYNSTEEFKKLRLEFLDRYKALWITETKFLYKELGEVLNEKHSMDLNTILSTAEHDTGTSNDGIPF